MIFDSLEAVFIIFALIGVGLFVSWRKWVSREMAKAFPKIIINISLPATIVVSLYNNFSREQLLSAWLPLFIIFTVAVLAYYVAKAFAYLLRVPRHRRGVFIVAFAFSNSIFIGFPVARALFGEAGMPSAVFCFIAGHVTFWLMGSFAIKRDADIINGQTHRLGIGKSLIKLAQPPTLVTFIMFIVIFSGIKLPDVILTTAKYIGDLTTPLSLVFIGCTIYGMGLKGMRWEKGLIFVILGRFIVTPALCYGICTLFIFLFASQTAGEFTFMRNVFIMQISLPALMQTSILAEHYGADTEFATKCIFFTTALSLITIPAYMLLLSAI